MKWEPIKPLLNSQKNMHGSPLDTMRELWNNERERISRLNTFDVFLEKMNREWAVETGLIENLYSLDRGVTQLLIEQGFDAALIPHSASKGQSTKAIVEILRDQEDTLQNLFDFVKGDRPLTCSYIKELHAQLTRNQKTTEAIDQFGNVVEVELMRGAWKTTPNNPTRPDGILHEYCPPIQTEEQMARLVDLHAEHLVANVSPEVMAAWLHHRFTQIHPFQDGNGRVARSLASLVLIKAGLFPFTVEIEKRDIYIDSLEAADRGDLVDLIEFISKQQSRALRKALSLAEQVGKKKQQEGVLISAAIERVRNRLENKKKDFENVFKLSEKIVGVSENKMNKIVDQIRREGESIGLRSRIGVSNEDDSHYFYHDVISVAKKLDYYANFNDFHKWVRLGIFEENSKNRFDIVLSIHTLGYGFNGTLTAVAFCKNKPHEVEQDHQKPELLSEEPFVFHYNQSADVMEEQFSEWMDEVITAGLAAWQQSL